MQLFDQCVAADPQRFGRAIAYDLRFPLSV
jgi:hypothetical protein